MSIKLEKIINENEYLKETLEASKKIRIKKAEETQEKVEMSKEKRKSQIDEPFDRKKYLLGKVVYKPLRLLMIANTKLSGAKNIILNEYKHIDDGKPIIYVPTHVCRYDIELVFETIKQHAHLLSGTEDRMLGSLEGTLLGLNGVNYVDRSDADDRKLAVRKMDKDLKNGVNLMIFPEGTWNISENLLIQPISYSVIDLAIKNRAGIELVAFDQEGKQIFTNYGGRLDINEYRKKLEPVYDLLEKLYKKEQNIETLNLIKELEILKKEQLIEATIKLRDAMATLKWDTMVYKEEYLQTKINPKKYNKKEFVRNNPDMDYNYYTKREDLDKDYWGNCIADMVKEWFMTDLLEEDKYIYKPKGDAYDHYEDFNFFRSVNDGNSVIEKKPDIVKLKRR